MAKAISSDVRAELASVPHSYFAAVDRLDVDDVLSHFADDATLTVQTDGVTFTGADEIRRMFTDFFASWDAMVHEITNLVVDDAETGHHRLRTDGSVADRRIEVVDGLVVELLAHLGDLVDAHARDRRPREAAQLAFQ